jgi:hypothetical protein
MSHMQQYHRQDQPPAQHYRRPSDTNRAPRPVPAETNVRPAVPTSNFSSPTRRPSNTQPAMPQYTSRDVGDPSQIKKTKQSMADLKLRRLTELNNRLREDLERERIPVSSASKR